MNLIVYLSRLLLISSRLIHHTFVVKLKSEFIQKRPALAFICLSRYHLFISSYREETLWLSHEFVNSVVHKLNW